jgi:small subunit ribosomal protein S16
VAVVLRLARTGKHKTPSYRIVASEKQSRRDGKFLEIIGLYQPLNNPAKVVIKEESVKKWMSLGALPSETVRQIIVKNIPGLVEGREKHQLEKIQAARRARKARAKKK